MLDALVQIFDGNNGGWLLAWTLGNMCSIAVFNFAGITVIKELSATTRAVLDQLRIVFIWAIFLIPFGPFLCIMQVRKRGTIYTDVMTEIHKVLSSILNHSGLLPLDGAHRSVCGDLRGVAVH